MFKKRFLATVLTLLLPTASQAGIEGDMQQWFTDVGAYGNVTGANVYKGQTTTVYSGGSLYMRTPVRNYQLATFTPPSIKGGCGGIDLFAGSFSFINKEQLTALFRNIANNAVGPAFMMAVNAISPEIAADLKHFIDILNKLNAHNINSCQAATGIVEASKAAITGESGREIGNTLATGFGFASDFFATKVETQDPGQQQQARNVVMAASPSTKDILEPGNVVWKALLKINNIDNETRQLIMSMTGTIIIHPQAEGGQDKKAKWDSIEGTSVSFKDFIGDSGTAKRKVASIICDEYAECKNPVRVDETAGNALTIGSFTKYVSDRMAAMSGKITSRGPVQTSGDLSLVNSSSVPVWRLLAMGTQMPNSGIVDQYNQFIAVDIAYHFFNTYLKGARQALSNVAGNSQPDVTAAVNHVEQRITELESQSTAVMHAMLTQTIQIADTQRRVQQINETLTAGMSKGMQASLATFGGR
jgi:conjugative transfer pilus assembly protein TraH